MSDLLVFRLILRSTLFRFWLVVAFAISLLQLYEGVFSVNRIDDASLAVGQEAHLFGKKDVWELESGHTRTIIPCLVRELLFEESLHELVVSTVQIVE